MRITKIVGIIAALLVGLFLGHPYIVAFPNRVAEWRFTNGMHVGMSKPDVIALAHRTGNTGDYGTLEADRRHIYLFYPHAETVCLSWGTEYTLFLDASGNVTRWTHQPFNSYC